MSKLSKRFQVSFATENDAFAYDSSQEIARILRNIAEKVEAGVDEGAVYDLNGNRVGDFALKGGW